MSGIKKLAKERAKKAIFITKSYVIAEFTIMILTKRRDWTQRFFITEGDSASGSITKTRNINTQAVFSLRGKPLNSFGLSKKIVYENEEFNLLQSALNIENGIDELRYNKIVIATDADVDGMHIRLLILTFFFNFL